MELGLFLIHLFCLLKDAWEKGGKKEFLSVFQGAFLFVKTDQIICSLPQLCSRSSVTYCGQLTLLFLTAIIKVINPDEIPCVIYWPSTMPSIKRCTCVNKRKNNGNRCALNNNITRAQTAWVSWSQDARVRASCRQRALGPQWSTVEQPQPRWERSTAMVEEELGVNIAVCPRLQLISHTQQHHPFTNKVWERYFYKEVCSFVHWSLYIIGWLFPHVSIYLYMYTCSCITAIQHLLSLYLPIYCKYLSF